MCAARVSPAAIWLERGVPGNCADLVAGRVTKESSEKREEKD